MKLIFVADPLDSFHIAKDSTYAMMHEATRRGHTVWVCEVADLVWHQHARVVARQARAILISQDRIKGDGQPSHAWFEVIAQAEVALADMDAVLMRKDPPFDNEYFYLVS